ncbi:phage tail protein [Thauera sp.]|jgi:phage tail-like protein|uniref:phage tail protein n=1 Tax=Thauera sp. TaxID=1905334 RepID=UPI002632D129|nr:phage tail protein [Thauera sp.]
MPEADFLSSFNFAVHIELSGLGGDEGLALGNRRGAFSEVQGLEMTLEPVSFREGGYNRGARQLVGKASHPALVLKRGLALDPAFWNWVQRCVDGSFPLPYVSGTIRVQAADTSASDAATWRFENGIVTKVRAADLNAAGSREVALEELHIVHEGLSREQP